MVKRSLLLAIAFSSFANATEPSFNATVTALAEEAAKKTKAFNQRVKSTPDDKLKLLSIEETPPPKNNLTFQQAIDQANASEASSDNADTKNGSASSDNADAKNSSASSDNADAKNGSASSDNADAKNGSVSSDNADAKNGSVSSDNADTKNASTSNDNARTNQQPKPKPKPSASEHYQKTGIYIPPQTGNRSASRSGSYGTLSTSNQKWGISFGTWVEAEITREVTSGDNAEMELLLTKPVKGKNRTIPAGTIIYAKKAFNQQTHRLEIYTTKARTPDDKEISKFPASGYDLSKRSGLDGAVVRHREDVYSNAAWDAFVGVAADTAGAALPTNTSSIKGLLSTAESLESSQGNPIPYTITVSPQKFYLRIDESI